MKDRVTAGFYKRYDGQPIYVIDILKDVDTNEEFVVCKNNSYCHSDYFVISKKSFCATVDVNCEVKKYTRASGRPKADNFFLSEIEGKGYRAPIRHKPSVPNGYRNNRQQCHSYYNYAKDLLCRFHYDVAVYNLCVKEKKLIEVDTKAEFLKMKEDLFFVKHAFDTVLKEYRDFFHEMFDLFKPIRQYAQEQGISRGSVVYKRNKLYNKLAELLEARDKADGKTRIIMQ